MSADHKPEKTIALANGRVPAELSRVARQLCGRIPPNSYGILENFGRVPPTISNALLAKPAKAAQPATQNVNNASQNIAASGMPSAESSSKQIASRIARKDSH